MFTSPLYLEMTMKLLPPLLPPIPVQRDRRLLDITLDLLACGGGMKPSAQ